MSLQKNSLTIFLPIFPMVTLTVKQCRTIAKVDVTFFVMEFFITLSFSRYSLFSLALYISSVFYCPLSVDSIEIGKKSSTIIRGTKSHQSEKLHQLVKKEWTRLFTMADLTSSATYTCWALVLHLTANFIFISGFNSRQFSLFFIVFISSSLRAKKLLLRKYVDKIHFKISVSQPIALWTAGVSL